MKISTLLSFLYICLFSPVMGQWTAVNTGTSSHLNDLIFTDANTGFCIGNNGTVLKSTDGGMSWNGIYHNTGLSLQCIAVNTAGTLAIKGQKNSSQLFLMYSSDQGSSWQIDSTTYTYLGGADDRIQAAGTQFFFIQGFDYALMSGTPGSYQEMRQQTYSFDFHTPLKGFALEDNLNSVVQTSDAGANWSSKPNNLTQAMLSNNQPIWGMKFPETSGVAAFWHDYPPGIVISVDGGTNFSKVEIDIRDYVQLSNDLILATGNAGLVSLELTGFTKDTLLGAGFKGIAITLHPDSAIFTCGMGGEMYYLPSISQITGIAQPQSSQPKIQINPNPAKEQITVSLPKNMHPDSMYVTDLTGKCLRNFKGNKRHLDVSGLSPGTYWLVLKENGGQVSGKFIIQQ